MKRTFGLVLLAFLLGTSSGCSIIDRLFLLNTDGPYAHQARHAAGGCEQGTCTDGQCGPGGQCGAGGCGPGGCQPGCQDCASGSCKGRHIGRYGGLAKHHLSPEEKAALGASDYGATGPAGPPSGAVAYPYYTPRGPREFLARCPPSVGP